MNSEKKLKCMNEMILQGTSGLLMINPEVEKNRLQERNGEAAVLVEF